MTTITIDVERLAEDEYVAEFAWNNSGDPQGALDALDAGMAAYVQSHDVSEGTLPDSVCGPASTLYALGCLLLAVHADNPITAMVMISESQQYAAHALDHGDRIAVDVFGCRDGSEAEETTLGDVLQRAQDWVLAHLPQSDPDAFLQSVDVFAALDATPPEGTDAA